MSKKAQWSTVSPYLSSPRPRQMLHIPDPLQKGQSVLLFKLPSVFPVE